MECHVKKQTLQNAGELCEVPFPNQIFIVTRMFMLMILAERCHMPAKITGKLVDQILCAKQNHLFPEFCWCFQRAFHTNTSGPVGLVLGSQCDHRIGTGWNFVSLMLRCFTLQ